MGEWRPDILGDGFEQQTLPLGSDAEGEVVATLVRSRPHAGARLFGALREVDVLYVHGWSDYFFQTDLARFFTDRGARFHALDLRKYGRSLRPGQAPGYVAALDVYDADIAAALEVMGTSAEGRRLVLLGHSTGGLTLTLWAARHPGVADALVLNSPWLELQLGPLARQALAPIVQARARFDPLGTHPVVDLGFYTRAQRDLGTLPDSPEGWRPAQGFPTHPGWLAAIIAGHARVASGVDVGCPALVLLSARSTPALSWNDAMRATDSVLVVDDIARAATRISSTVTITRIDGALHDVFLSAPDARARAFDALDAGMRGLA
ncbi:MULTISPECIES: alpha/beta hydrolase [Microbacterium]|uniref:Alpha/beta hydrolase n=1 Tax=Microbacterium algihabitans TaxID=3075992 RepID=A0ABU3RWI1_9MICO|nr:MULTISPECIES: alpha/beta hydrolase [Microbacterium]MCD2170581.1 alpha/beta hydrolase [Microbacterium sp. JC 701]MDQ1175072.1 alpha-beta hydrolase superfamily lysophospholipase [Microbacterium testaceum]MDU0327238.1 alpha/beta hydrolase [Microbacterium sp. KSW2-21]